MPASPSSTFICSIPAMAGLIASAEGAREPQTGKQGKDRHYDAGKRIAEGFDLGSPLPERHEIQREGRKGREAAEHADGDEEPRFLRSPAQGQHARDETHG